MLFDDVCPPYCPGGLTFDVGYGANSTKLLRLLPGEAADAALLLGDLSYAQGFAADWDVFGEMFEAAAFTRWPVLVGVGNHERDWPGTGDAFEGLSRDSGGECGVPYALRFVTPAPRPALLGAGEAPAAAAQRLQHFYSANVGAVHFLVLDSEAPTHAGSPQRAFAEADLARVDRAATPWVVVGLHRMVYAPSSDRRRVVGDQAVMARLRADLDALFTAHWVRGRRMWRANRQAVLVMEGARSNLLAAQTARNQPKSLLPRPNTQPHHHHPSRSTPSSPATSTRTRARARCATAPATARAARCTSWQAMLGLASRTTSRAAPTAAAATTSSRGSSRRRRTSTATCASPRRRPRCASRRCAPTTAPSLTR